MKVSSILLSLTLALTMLPSTALATEITTAGGTNEVPVELTQEATAFSVTVPTVLPVDVSSTGIVTVATDNKIINNSFGPVEVKGIELVSLNDWTLQEFSTDFKTKKVGIKEYGFQLNGEDVATEGSCSADSFGIIPGNDEISFSYNANVSSQNTALDKEQIAQVIFTMGWSENASLVPGLYDSNGTLLCTWQESGIDIEQDYTTQSGSNYYGTSITAPRYILTNKYPTATKVVIPNDITFIGEWAFCQCDSIETIIIPNSITSIEDNAFYASDGITTVVIPNSVTYLGEYAFYNCSGLASVIVGDGISTLKTDTFSRCYALTSIVFPNNLQSIGDRVLYQCYNLTSILYQGNQTQWNKISKGNYWDTEAGKDVGGYTITYNYS